MSRRAIAFGVAIAVSASLAACGLSETGARARGAHELQCPEVDLTVTARPDRSDDTYEVVGCGRRAIYTCMKRQPPFCVREPDENPRLVDPPR